MSETWSGKDHVPRPKVSEEEGKEIREAVIAFFKEDHPPKAYYIDQYVYASTGKSIMTHDIADIYMGMLEVDDIHYLKLKQ